jgi:hypothetical protein
MHFPGLATFRFDGTVGEITAIAASSARADLIEDAYRRTVLPLALQASGLEVLHASAVLTPRGVVAFCAGSGTGKSTVACGLARRGYALWADDAVALEIAEEAVHAIPLPFRLRLRPASASFFGGPPTVGVESGAEHEERPERAPVRLAALCSLRRAAPSGDGTLVTSRRLSPARALPALLADAQCFSLDDAVRKRRLVTQYLTVVARVAVVEITFQARLESLSSVLDAIESALAAVPAEAA